MLFRFSKLKFILPNESVCAIIYYLVLCSFGWGAERMAMDYRKLWKLLIDRNMMKKDLREKAKISTNAMAKMTKGGDVSTQVLRRICQALDCELNDIVDIVRDEEPKA